MLRPRRLFLGLVPALPILVAIGACGDAPVRIGLVMSAPLGLLDNATGVSLRVFSSTGARCTPETGRVENAPTSDAVQSFDLKKTGCAAGVTWCKTIELDRDGAEKIFAITAKDASGVLAEGCAVEKIDQDPLEINIKVVRFNPPKCCGDGMIQTGEQCDSGVAAPNACITDPGTTTQCGGVVLDEVCRCDCTAEDILLSVDNVGMPNLTNGDVGSKTQLSMTFSKGIDATTNALRAVFTNTEGSGSGDIHMRFLADNLFKIKDPYPLSQQMRLPTLCANVNGPSPLLIQRDPSISPVGPDAVAIAFASDQEQANSFHAWLNVQNAYGCADTDSLKVSTQPGGDELKPDVAGGPDDAALVVWNRGTAVVGRIWNKKTGLLFPDADELPIGPDGSNPRVAGNKDGWVVVYQGADQGDGDGIFFVTVDTSGKTTAPAIVNDATPGLQDQPDVAMLSDGRSIVVWHSATGDDILFQRYGADRKRLVDAEEQLPLNTLVDGVQQHPAIAAGLGFFAVAWEDVGGSIFARYVGATSGFGYNSVTGQNDSFRASIPDAAGVTGLRKGPAVAIGGAGFVAFGWQDDEPNHHGVYVRRFPQPAGL